MGSQGPNPDVTRADVRTVFSRFDSRSAPLSAAEIAERLESPPGAVRERLAELADRGEVRSREVTDAAEVWWRPGGASPLDDRSDGGEEFGALVDAVEDYAIFMIDPEGVVVSWNEGAKRIKGYDEAEIVGEHFSTFYTEADVEDGVPERNLERAATEGRVETRGWRVRADGTEFWADVTITAVRDDGALRGYTKVTRDMTDQREYQQRLRRERDLTQQVVETAPVSIAVVTGDGELVRANQRMLDRLGLEAPELSDYSVRSWDVRDAGGDRIPADELPWSRAAETGEAVSDFECRVTLPTVGERWLSINAAPLENGLADDQVVVAVDDVTERNERERELRRESEQTEKLLRTAPIPIAVHDASGETVMANWRAQSALGISERGSGEDGDAGDEWGLYDADGEPVSPDDGPSARVLETGEPVYGVELTVDPPSGDRMQFRVNAAPLSGADGSVERVVTAAEDVTELKARERQLEHRKTELETELSEILGRISDAFYALDDDWRFTHLNEHAAEIMQHDADELLGREVWEVFPDSPDGVYGEQFRTAMETQDPVSFEVYEEGIDAWLEFNVYPSESGLSIYFRDVSERREYERKLEQSERRYRTLIDHFPDGAVGLYDENLEYVVAGGESFDDLGVPEDAVVGSSLSDRYSADLLEEIEPYFRAVFDGESNTFEYRAHGRDVWAHTLPVRDEDGEIFGGMIMVQDITERKERERELAKYETIVETIEDGIYVKDEDGRFTMVNDAYAELTGYDREELIGEHASLVVDEAAIRESRETRAAADADDERIPSTEATIQTADGDRVPAEGTVSTLRTADGERKEVGVVRDISERKERQRRLEESNERLEQFAYAASHDLQEPLRMVSSYLQLIEQRYGDELDEDGREFLDFAVDGADRMREMIQGLLRYSRVETGGDPFEPVDLDTVLADVRDDLQVKIEESDATVEADSLPPVLGDRGQLRQLFQNLIDNAIEYSGDEPPRVTISAARDGEEWVISVRDRGTGIEPGDADRVFEVFQSFDGDGQAGTGIGLALCERIVERHGGDIWVESEPGEGSTFSFTLSAVADR